MERRKERGMVKMDGKIDGKDGRKDGWKRWMGRWTEILLRELMQIIMCAHSACGFVYAAAQSAAAGNRPKAGP